MAKLALLCSTRSLPVEGAANENTPTQKEVCSQQRGVFEKGPYAESSVCVAVMWYIWVILRVNYTQAGYMCRQLRPLMETHLKYTGKGEFESLFQDANQIGLDIRIIIVFGLFFLKKPCTLDKLTNWTEQKLY